jgi:hypothetical protein
VFGVTKTRVSTSEFGVFAYDLLLTSAYRELVPFYFPASQNAEETKESNKGQATTGETEPEPETSTPSTL